MKKLVNGVAVEMSAEEAAEVQAEWDSNAARAKPTKEAPTKQQLLSEMESLKARIQALEK